MGEKAIEFYFEMRVEHDGDLWSAYCDEFDMAASGATRGEAEANLIAVLQALASAFRERKRNE